MNSIQPNLALKPTFSVLLKALVKLSLSKNSKSLKKVLALSRRPKDPKISGFSSYLLLYFLPFAISSPSSGKIVKEVSYVLRPNRVTSSKKRLDSTNNTTIKYSDTSSRYDPQCSPVSKSPSLLNAILSPVIPQNIKSHRNFDRTLSRNSSPNQTILNPSILTNRQNLNFSMATSHRQPLNTSQSFVQVSFLVNFLA